MYANFKMNGCKSSRLIFFTQIIQLVRLKFFILPFLFSFFSPFLLSHFFLFCCFYFCFSLVIIFVRSIIIFLKGSSDRKPLNSPYFLQFHMLCNLRSNLLRCGTRPMEWGTPVSYAFIILWMFKSSYLLFFSFQGLSTLPRSFEQWWEQ